MDDTGREIGKARGVIPALYLSHGAPPLVDDELWVSQLVAWAGETGVHTVRTGTVRDAELDRYAARHALKDAMAYTTDLKTMTRALALIMGPEAVIVVKDVLQLDDADARKMKRWAIRALVEAARKPPARD